MNLQGKCIKYHTNKLKFLGSPPNSHPFIKNQPPLTSTPVMIFLSPPHPVTILSLPYLEEARSKELDWSGRRRPTFAECVPIYVHTYFISHPAAEYTIHKSNGNLTRLSPEWVCPARLALAHLPYPVKMLLPLTPQVQWKTILMNGWVVPTFWSQISSS